MRLLGAGKTRFLVLRACFYTPAWVKPKRNCCLCLRVSVFVCFEKNESIAVTNQIKNKAQEANASISCKKSVTRLLKLLYAPLDKAQKFIA